MNKDIKKFRVSQGEISEGEGECTQCNKKFETLLRIEKSNDDAICFDCYGNRFGSIEISDLIKRIPSQLLDQWTNPILEVGDVTDFTQLSVPQLIEERSRIEYELESGSERLDDRITTQELNKLFHISNKQRGDYLLKGATIRQVYEDAVIHLRHEMLDRPYSKAIDLAQTDFEDYLDTITDKDGNINRDEAIEYAQNRLNEIDRSNFRTGEAKGLDDFTKSIDQIILTEDGKRKKYCTRCNKTQLKYPMILNAKSRVDNKTWICSECGIDEALSNEDKKKLRINKKTFQRFLDEVLPKDIPNNDANLITNYLMVQYLTDERDEKFMEYFKDTGGNIDQLNKITQSLRHESQEYVNEFRKRILDETINGMTLLGIKPLKLRNQTFERIYPDKTEKKSKDDEDIDIQKITNEIFEEYFNNISSDYHNHIEIDRIIARVNNHAREVIKKYPKLNSEQHYRLRNLLTDKIKNFYSKQKRFKNYWEDAKIVIIPDKTEKKSRFIQFEEAREWALDQKCHSRQDWMNLTKTDDFPDNIPIHPENKYPEFKEFGGFPNFCGYTQKVRREPLTKDRVLEILRTFEQRWEFYAEYTTGMVTNWFETQGLFSVKDPYVQTLLTKLTSWKLDPDSIEALRYWCRTGDFEKKFGTYSLEPKTEETTTDYLDRQPTNVQALSISGLLEDSISTGVEKIMLNARMVVPDESDKEWYDQQVVFCVRNIMMRFCDPDRETEEIKKLRAEPTNGNRFHDDILKLALKEYELVSNIYFDKEYYSFPHLPTFLQKYHAYKTREKNSFFNMSGTGKGKTGATIIGAVANRCTHILVVVPNNIVPQWVRNIRKFYNNAFVFSGKELHRNFFIESGKHMPKFHVINYDKFGRSDLARRFIEQIGSNNIDMVVFDEGQLVKTRDGDPNYYSNRRKNIETLVDHLRNTNRKLKVNILSATPVINNIREGKSLLELLTGTKYGFSTRNTLRNANKLHTEFIPFSVVYSKRPDLKEVGRDEPIFVEAYLPENLTDEEIQKLNWNELEQIATRYRIPKIIEILKQTEGKTVIYTDYVTGIVSQLRTACIDAGFRVGEFTGDDKSGMIEKTGFTDREGNEEVINKFVSGDIDVLIASRPFQLGIDEVQFVCNNLIFNGLVWTYAEYEQICGRVSREGSNFDQVNIHLIMANINGYEYDKRIKYNRIQKKRAIGDCVRYGTLPDELDIPDTKGERLRALKAMIENKQSGFPERELIEQKHSLEAEQEIEGKITELNEKFSQIEAKKNLRSDLS